MKKTFKFLFFVAFLLMPAIAIAEPDPVHCWQNTNQTDCANASCSWNSTSSSCRPDCDNAAVCNETPGCGTTGGVIVECNACGLGEFNRGDSDSSGCTTCNSSYYDGTDGKEYSDALANIVGLSFCPWKCASGWYESNDYVAETGAGSCEQCPPSNGNDTSWGVYPENPNEAQQHISHCGCDSDLSLIHHSVNNSGHKYFCGVCGDGTQGDDGYGVVTCNCFVHANRVAGGGFQNDNTGPRVECQCPTGAVVQNDECVCTTGYFMRNTEDGYECVQCPDNSEVSGTTCICKQNYYNANTDVNERPNCLRCPNGTFKDASNAGITACQMNHNTQFCDANGANCMQLIP